MSMESKNIRMFVEQTGIVCRNRATEISSLQAELSRLNTLFPGERKKGEAMQRAEYRIAREKISPILESLVKEQKRDRAEIRLAII